MDTSPIFCVAKTQRRRVRCISLSLLLRFYEPHPVRLRDTAGEDCDTKNFLSQPKKVLVTLIRFICSFFSTARRTNQEAPPFFINPSVTSCHLPYILRYKTPRKAMGHGRGGVKYLSSSLFYCCFNPSVLWTPPLYFAPQNTP